MSQSNIQSKRIDFATTLDSRTKAFTVVGALLGLFLAALDQTIVATALTKISDDLNGVDLYTWIITAYLLASTAMVPVYGKLSDIYGRRTILLVGITIFLSASAACGAATSMVMLIALRAVQGLGAAALTSTAFAVVADLFEPRTRSKVQGGFGAVFGLASVLGPLLGGLLTDHLSWRWVFYVNIPIGLVAAAFVIARMPALKADPGARVDYLGSLALVSGAVPLLLSLSLRRFSLLTGILSVAGLGGLGLFLFVESRAPSPLLPLRLFRNRQFAAGVATSFFFGAAFLGAIVFIPMFVQQVVGVSATNSGFTLMPLTLTMVAGAAASGQIGARTGRYKQIMLVGLTVVILGYFVLSQLRVDASQQDVSWRMLVLGLGFGPCMPMLTVIIQGAVPRHEIGVATSTRQFVQQFGSVFGSALMGLLLGVTLHSETSERVTPLIAQFPPGARRQLEAVWSGPGATRLADRRAAADTATVGAQQDVDAQFKRWRADLDKAMVDRDPAARARLSSDADLPSSIKELIAGSEAAGAAGVAEAHDRLDRGRELMTNQLRRLSDDLSAATRESITTAVTRIFRWAMVLAFLALLLASRLPETSVAGAAARPKEGAKA